ncbi:MAG: hypothetical protein ACI4HJ_00800 [Ruminococcus sp.]
MKKLLALLMVLVLGISLCACSTDNTPEKVEALLQGDWISTLSDSVEATYTFSNGSVSCATKAMGIELAPNTGTYEITDSHIIITWSNSNTVEFNYTIENDELSISANDGTKILKK